MRTLLLLLLGAAGPLLAEEPPTNALPPRVAVPAPAFMLRDTAGREVRLADFKNRVVLVVFIVPGSEPCDQQLPALRELARRHADRPFTILLLAVDNAAGTATKKWAAETAPGLLVLLADFETIKGFGGVTGVPLSLLLESEHHQIVARYEGVTPADTMDHDITAILPK